MSDTVTTPPVEDDGDDLQAIYDKEMRRDPYRFRWADRWWTLPAFADLDIDVQNEIEQWGNQSDGVTLDHVHALFGKLLGAEQAEDWKSTVRPGQFLGMMMKRWIAHSGRKPGEAQASPASSKTTARPSKRTSTGSTGSASTRRSTAARKTATPRGNSST